MSSPWTLLVDWSSIGCVHSHKHSGRLTRDSVRGVKSLVNSSRGHGLDKKGTSPETRTMEVNLPAECGTTRLWAGGPRPATLAARGGLTEGDSGRPASPKLLTAVTAGTPSRCRPSRRWRCASGRESRKARTAAMIAVLTSLNGSMDGDETSSGRRRRWATSARSAAVSRDHGATAHLVNGGRWESWSP